MQSGGKRINCGNHFISERSSRPLRHCYSLSLQKGSPFDSPPSHVHIFTKDLFKSSHLVSKISKFDPGEKPSQFPAVDFGVTLLQGYLSALRHQGPPQAEFTDRQKPWLVLRGGACGHGDIKCVFLKIIDSNWQMQREKETLGCAHKLSN